MTSGGLRVVFDPAIDRGARVGIPTRAAALGEARLGPNGLLGRLELELGLGGAPASPLERATRMVTQLAPRDGWWRASYDADALGTCRRLLRDRDALALWGWRGEPASERLEELWAATAGAGPGIPDRLHDVRTALADATVPIDSIDLRSPVAAQPMLWRALFEVWRDEAHSSPRSSIGRGARPCASSTSDGPARATA